MRLASKLSMWTTFTVGILLVNAALPAYAQTLRNDKIAAYSVPSVFQVFAVVDSELTFSAYQLNSDGDVYAYYPNLSDRLYGLVKDVRNRSKGGEATSTLRQHFVSNGWSVKEVNTALDVVQHPEKWTEKRTFEEQYIIQSGTAFAVDENGYLVTNAHVVSVDKDEAQQNLLFDYVGSTSTLQLISSVGIDENSYPDTYTVQDSISSYLRENIELSRFNVSYKILPPLIATSSDMDEVIKNGWNATLVRSGEPYPGKDVAILKLDILHKLPVLTLSSVAPQVGDKIYVAGYPTAANLTANIENQTTFTSGAVNAKRTSENGDFTVYQTDASIGSGSSGGPALDLNGNVIGVITLGGGEEGGNFNYFLPISLAAELFKDAGVVVYGPKEITASYREGINLLDNGKCDDGKKKLEDLQAFLQSGFINQLIEKCVPTASSWSTQTIIIDSLVVLLVILIVALYWHKRKQALQILPVSGTPPPQPGAPGPTSQPPAAG